MTVVRLSQIHLSFQGNPILENVSATVSEGARIGVVGPNGSGKTSLLKVMLGSQEFRGGTVDWVKKPKLGYIPQFFALDEGRTPLELVGYERAEYLGQCGVGRSLWNSASSSLSGGEKTRLSLAMAFSQHPEMLILDEPTNHLDIPGIEWLEKQLSSFRGTVVTVSHDRSFLDAVCKEIWEVRDRHLAVYPGNYSAYLAALRARRAHELREYTKWSREVRELAVEIQERRQWYDKAHKDAGKNDFYRRKAKKHARQFLAKETALARLAENKPQVTRDDIPLKADISHAGKRTQTVLRAEILGFAYPASGYEVLNERHEPSSQIESPARQIIKQANFHVRPGQKIGLIGRNGSGKTTLLRLITGSLSLDEGTLWLNPGVKVGYLAQMLEGLDTERSAAENVSAQTGLLIADARNLLGRLGVTGETQTQSFAALSMGERTRVAIACLCFGAFDLLLLDEPTNHLDVAAREAVELALESFPGAIIVATHDRFLLDQVCDTIWHLESTRLQTHHGTYTDYRNRVANTALPAEKDREAAELAAKAEIAYLVSLISAAKDAAEKVDLERRYELALAKLKGTRASSR